MNIGNRIKKRREALGLSQEELAKKVGYKSRSSINKIELDGRGLPQSKIVAFAKALDTTPAYLMGWDADAMKDDREETKISARIILNDPNASINDKYNAKLQEYSALYARSLEASERRGEIYHPDFEIYVSMLLGQDYEKNRMQENLYNLLVDNFGITPGMKNATTYWYSSNCTDDSLYFSEVVRIFTSLSKDNQVRVLDYLELLQRTEIASVKTSASDMSLIENNSCLLPLHRRLHFKSDDNLTNNSNLIDAAHSRTDIDIEDGADTAEDNIMDEKDF